MLIRLDSLWDSPVLFLLLIRLDLLYLILQLLYQNSRLGLNNLNSLHSTMIESEKV
nr:MAG TPA: hypothetical protein [Caudoviricetes sp.]